MYPVLFRIGSLDITSFGVFMAVAALAGFWLFKRELASSGLPLVASEAALAGIVGGLGSGLWMLRRRWLPVGVDPSSSPAQ